MTDKPTGYAHAIYGHLTTLSFEDLKAFALERDSKHGTYPESCWESGSFVSALAQKFGFAFDYDAYVAEAEKLEEAVKSQRMLDHKKHMETK